MALPSQCLGPAVEGTELGHFPLPPAQPPRSALVPNSPWQKPKHHWYFAADGSVGHLVAFFSALTMQGAYRPPTYTNVPKGTLLGGDLKGVNPSHPV